MKSILDNLKQGDLVMGLDSTGIGCKGEVVEIHDQLVKLLVVTETKSVVHEMDKRAIHTINDRYVFSQLASGQERTPRVAWAIEWASNKQLEGELSEHEIMRQVLTHIATSAGNSQAFMVTHMCKQINMAVRELMSMGEYNTVASVGRELVKQSLDILAYPESRVRLQTASPEFEIDMARYNQVWSKTMALGLDQFRELLTPEGQALLLNEFDAHKSQLFE